MGIKLSLACGNQYKPHDYIGVDIVETPSTDCIADLLKFPWPFDDECADEIDINHFVEHIPHGDGTDLFFQFFDEVYRILQFGGLVHIRSPYYTSIRAWQDPTHRRAISEATFLYVQKEWRKEHKLDHYDVKCDFAATFDYVYEEEWMLYSERERNAFRQRYNNVVKDILVTLVKLP